MSEDTGSSLSYFLFFYELEILDTEATENTRFQISSVDASPRCLQTRDKM